MIQAENNFLSEQTIKAQEIIAKKKTETKLLEDKVKLNAVIHFWNWNIDTILCVVLPPVIAYNDFHLLISGLGYF